MGKEGLIKEEVSEATTVLEEGAYESSEFTPRKIAKSEAANRDEVAREATTDIFLTCNDNNFIT